MTPNEKIIQTSLGLMKTYIGYIQIDDSSQFIKYEVKAPTYKSARLRLKNICKRHNNDIDPTNLDDFYTLAYMNENDADSCPDHLGEILIIETRKTSV